MGENLSGEISDKPLTN